MPQRGACCLTKLPLDAPIETKPLAGRPGMDLTDDGQRLGPLGGAVGCHGVDLRRRVFHVHRNAGVPDANQRRKRCGIASGSVGATWWPRILATDIDGNRLKS
jgi:hypothetical protein